MDNTEIVADDIESMGNTVMPLVPPHETDAGDDEKNPDTDMDLWRALRRNNLHDIRIILQDKELGPINIPSEKESTPLMLAISYFCSLDIIEYLVNRMTSEMLAYSNSMSNNRECSAINIAIYKCNFSATKILISKHPALFNSRDTDGKTPIPFALSINNMGMAYYLLKLFLTHVQDNEEFQLTVIEILEAAFKHRVYDFAFNLCHQYPKLALNISTWEILIQYSDDFSYKRQLNIMQSIIYSMIRINAETLDASIHHPREKANSRFSINSNAYDQGKKNIVIMLELIIFLKRRYFRVLLKVKGAKRRWTFK